MAKVSSISRKQYKLVGDFSQFCFLVFSRFFGCSLPFALAFGGGIAKYTCIVDM